MELDFIGAAYTSRSKSIDCQECINLYPEVQQQNSKNVVALIGTAGSRYYYKPQESGTNRGLYTASTGDLIQIVGRAVIVNGVQDNSWSIPYRLDTQYGLVSMADNGTELIIVDGTNGYIVNLKTRDNNKITEEGFPANPSHVVFNNGYFIVNRGGTLEYYVSNLYYVTDGSGNHWSATNFYTAEGSPDPITAIATLNNELWLLGERSIEVHYNTGDADYQYLRVSSAFLNFGTGAPRSVATNSNTIFWLGSNKEGAGIVWSANGYAPQRVSTHAIENIIGKMENTDDATGYCYQQEGHSFYVLSFQSADITLVYDMTTGLWHKRTYYDKNNNEIKRHRSIVHTFYKGKNLVGDYMTAAIFELDLEYYWDDIDYTERTVIIRERTTSHNSNENKKIFYPSFELDMEKGTGNNDCPDPNVLLSWSNDGGFTWSNKIQMSIGKIGQYALRIIARRLGCGRDRVWKVVHLTPTKCVFIGAYIKAVSE